MGTTVEGMIFYGFNMTDSDPLKHTFTEKWEKETGLTDNCDVVYALKKEGLKYKDDEIVLLIAAILLGLTKKNL